MFFYLFGSLLVLAALGVVCFKNPVHSTLSLIFAFINSAGLFILLQAEFLAMMVVIVYVGAVAVLFLFVIMMLDTKCQDANGQVGKLWIVTIVLISITMIMFVFWLINLSDVNNKYSDLKIFIHHNISNTHMIAGVLYTRYIIAFQTAGVILLVAIVGAISLTSKRKLDIKRQDPNMQIARANTVKLQDVKINSGVTDIDYGV